MPLQDVSAAEPSAEMRILNAVPLEAFHTQSAGLDVYRRWGCYLQQEFLKENTIFPKCQGMQFQMIFHAKARIRGSINCTVQNVHRSPY